MPAPIQQVHLDQRRIRQLHDEDLVARDRADRVGVDLAGQGVETVEDQADAGVIGATHNLPGVAVIVDVPAPGESLVPDTDVKACGDIPEFAEIGGRPVDAAECSRRHVRAHQHQVGAQLVHQRELATGAFEAPGPQRLRQPLEIPKRLEQRDRQPEILDHSADLAGAGTKSEKVVLEDFDAVEARRGNGFQLLGEVAADRHRCNRGLQAAPINELVRTLGVVVEVLAVKCDGPGTPCSRKGAIALDRAEMLRHHDVAQDHVDGVSFQRCLRGSGAQVASEQF